MKKRFRVGSLALSLAIICGTFIPMTAQADDKVETENIKVTRYYGGNREKTAVDVSENIFKEGSEYVVIASGEDFPDALVGGTLANDLKAPILLVGKDSVSKEVKDEITRLKAEKVYLLGGSSTVSKKVEKELKDAKLDVERVSGKDRVDTANAIGGIRAGLAGMLTGGDIWAAIDGNDFPDALSAVPYISQMKEFMPLMPYMSKTEAGSYSLVFGGKSSVAIGEIEKLRFFGKDRYATAVEVARGFKKELGMDIDTLVLVDGNDYPDALAAAPAAYAKNAAILLTDSKELTEVTKEYIKENENIKEIIIVGGSSSVSNKIEEELKTLREKNPMDETEATKPAESEKPKEASKIIETENKTEIKVDNKDNEIKKDHTVNNK